MSSFTSDWKEHNPELFQTSMAQGGNADNTNNGEAIGVTNDEANVVKFELTEKIQKEEPVNCSVYERHNDLRLSLNQKYDDKTVVLPIYLNNWPKATDTFADLKVESLDILNQR